MDKRDVMNFRPHSLRVDGQGAGSVVSRANPELRWSLDGIKGRNVQQPGYEIEVRTSGADWTERSSATQPGIFTMLSRPLMSRQDVTWRVRAIIDDVPTQWSESFSFRTSLLNKRDWKAEWITRSSDRDRSENDQFAGIPSPVFGKQIRINGTVRRATWYAVALGYGEFFVGGKRVTDGLLSPGWTQFEKRVPFEALDVTKLLVHGDQWLTIHAGNGFWNPFPLKMWGSINLREHLQTGSPMAIAQLEIEYTDGRVQVEVTDSRWQCWDGPSLRNSVYLGERRDARLDVRLASPSNATKKVDIYRGPIGSLLPTAVEPVGALHDLQGKVIRDVAGKVVIDFGVNHSGRISGISKGSAGSTVTALAGERLYPDGTVNPMTGVCGQIKRRRNPPGSLYPVTASQEDELILSGDVDRWTPSFTFHGYRYVELSGLPRAPKTGEWTSTRLTSMVPETATFSCSDPMLTTLFDVTRSTFQSNMVSVQSDCPAREKFGYGGDILCTAETAWHLFDLERFYRKTVLDYLDSQRDNGGFTMTAPFVGIDDSGLGRKSGPVDWGTAVPVLVDGLLRFHGDVETARRAWPALIAWWQLLDVSSPGGILDNGLGDHETIAPRSTAVTGSFALLQNATLLARIAGALGKLDAKKRYEGEAQRIREAIRKKFYSESGTFGIESQACYAGALFHGVLTAKEAIPGLVRAVQAADGHVNAGIFGTMWLLEALSRHGRSDLAVQIATQRTYPGWGHMLANGATSLWETWKESDDTFSNNHPMFGSVAGWMMRWLVGIQVPDDSFAGDHVVIRPQTMTTISEAAGQWQCRRGLVGTRWERKGRYLMLTVTIPASVTADVHIPAGAGALISESGRSLTGHPDIQVIKRLKSAVVVNIGSGTYRFVVDSGQTGA